MEAAIGQDKTIIHYPWDD
jgi:hypothetical protein